MSEYDMADDHRLMMLKTAIPYFTPYWKNYFSLVVTICDLMKSRHSTIDSLNDPVMASSETGIETTYIELLQKLREHGNPEENEIIDMLLHFFQSETDRKKEADTIPGELLRERIPETCRFLQKSKEQHQP